MLMMHANSCKKISLVPRLMGYFYCAKASLSLHPRLWMPSCVAGQRWKQWITL